MLRNFCIIAHIDHGKSTLADRMLQLTGVVENRNMRAQYLDRMDIERERGITIKSQAVRLPWTGPDGQPYVLNLIDTPGHVDFSYEVSRSLAACEGAVLLVDAAQGIEAQTLANLYMALEADLQIIPVLNKIDLPAAQPDRYAEELAGIIGCDPGDVLRVSAKTGQGVEELLHEIVAQVPAPTGDPDAPARAMIFDSMYDTYRGVVTYVRVVDGRLSKRERSLMMSTGSVHETLEVGVISPEPQPSPALGVGEVGYLITGVKDVRQARVGDTVTSAAHPATEALHEGHPTGLVDAADLAVRLVPMTEIVANGQDLNISRYLKQATAAAEDLGTLIRHTTSPGPSARRPSSTCSTSLPKPGLRASMSDATGNGHAAGARDEWVRAPLAGFLTLNAETVDVEPERMYPTIGVLNRGRGLLYRDPFAGSSTSYRKLNRIGPGVLVYSRLKAFEGRDHCHPRRPARVLRLAGISDLRLRD